METDEASVSSVSSIFTHMRDLTLSLKNERIKLALKENVLLEQQKAINQLLESTDEHIQRHVDRKVHEIIKDCQCRLLQKDNEILQLNVENQRLQNAFTKVREKNEKLKAENEILKNEIISCRRTIIQYKTKIQILNMKNKPVTKVDFGSQTKPRQQQQQQQLTAVDNKSNCSELDLSIISLNSPKYFDEISKIFEWICECALPVLLDQAAMKYKAIVEQFCFHCVPYTLWLINNFGIHLKCVQLEFIYWVWLLTKNRRVSAVRDSQYLSIGVFCERLQLHSTNNNGNNNGNGNTQIQRYEDENSLLIDFLGVLLIKRIDLRVSCAERLRHCLDCEEKSINLLHQLHQLHQLRLPLFVFTLLREYDDVNNGSKSLNTNLGVHLLHLLWNFVSKCASGGELLDSLMADFHSDYCGILLRFIFSSYKSMNGSARGNKSVLACVEQTITQLEILLVNKQSLFVKNLSRCHDYADKLQQWIVQLELCCHGNSYLTMAITNISTHLDHLHS